jgi:Cytochrome c, mono- and diheme variants
LLEVDKHLVYQSILLFVLNHFKRCNPQLVGALGILVLSKMLTQVLLTTHGLKLMKSVLTEASVLSFVVKTTALCQLWLMWFLKQTTLSGLLGNNKQQQQQWQVATKTWSKAELMAQGESVYNTNCAGCHKKDGSGMPPIFPAMTGSPIANGAPADHISIVLHGKGGMPTFKMLGDADLAAVITYERNAFGNTGSVVQPSDVKSAR